MLVGRQLVVICFSSCVIVTTLTAPQLFGQTLQPIHPLPKNEASWLFQTCHGLNIPGSEPPGWDYVLSECVKKNGKNKVTTGFYHTVNSGTAHCRLGIDHCPDRTRANAFALTEEEFECRKGQKNGVYRANIVHQNHSQNIFGMRVEATYNGGKLHGESRHFPFSKKNMCFRYQYKNGLLDGKAERFVGATVSKDAFYKDGLLYGKSTSYEGSKVTSFETYEFGRLHGETSYHLRDGSWGQSFFEKGIEVKRINTINGVKIVKNRTDIELEQKQETLRWETLKASRKPKSIVPLFSLNLSYLNDDLENAASIDRNKGRVSGFTYGPQLTIGLVECKDIACSGYVLNLGAGKSLANDGAFYHGEVGAGLVVMYVSAYLGAGLRVDNGRQAAQITFMGGATLVNLFVRAFKYDDDDGGSGFESGLMLTYPSL